MALGGYQHKTVCHERGEYARDEDCDGFCEVHVNTMEGFWSLLRSWLRPHRGHLARQAAAIPQLLSVRAQRPPTRQSSLQHPHRCPHRVTGPSPPRNPTRANPEQPDLVVAATASIQRYFNDVTTPGRAGWRWNRVQSAPGAQQPDLKRQVSARRQVSQTCLRPVRTQAGLGPLHGVPGQRAPPASIR